MPRPPWPPSSLPRFLYRYVSRDRAVEILRDGKIYFCSPAKFNDPFDCRIEPSFAGGLKDFRKIASMLAKRRKPFATRKVRREMVQRVRSKLNSQSFAAVFQAWRRDMLDNSAMLCLAEEPDEILMWSHYADGHAGVCLKFQVDVGGIFGSLPLPVVYSDKIPRFSFIKDFANLQQDTLLEFGKLMFLTKSSKWKYEKEWRVIDFALGERPKYGLRSCSSSRLAGVIFGCRMSKDARQEVSDLTRNRDPIPALYEARIKKDEFGLDIIRADTHA